MGQRTPLQVLAQLIRRTPEPDLSAFETAELLTLVRAAAQVHGHESDPKVRRLEFMVNNGSRRAHRLLERGMRGALDFEQVLDRV